MTFRFPPVSHLIIKYITGDLRPFQIFDIPTGRNIWTGATFSEAEGYAKALKVPYETSVTQFDQLKRGVTNGKTCKKRKP